MTWAYWPWWLGGIALACVAVFFVLLLARPFGVSGMFESVLDARATIKQDRAFDIMTNDAEAQAEMVRMTRAHFKSLPMADMPEAPPGPPPARLRFPARAVFLLGAVAGAAIASTTHGTFGTTDPTFLDLFGRGAPFVAFGGGLLVGFGTQMTGGCTSGHGLTGCARLQVPSMIATATFLGTAVVTATALRLVLA